MPITVQPSPPLGRIGPGLPTVFQSSQSGPLPSGSLWNIRIYEPPPGELMIQQWIYEAQQTGQLILLGDMPLLQGMTNGSATVPDNTQVVVQSEIQTPLGTFDQGQQQLPWDGTTGVANLLQMYQQGQTQTQGGMTTEEHTWLDTTQQAVQRAFADALGIVHSTPLGSVLAHPDLAFLDVDGPVFVLTGRGVLDASFTPSPQYSHGMNIVVSQVPPSFGTRDGAMTAWNERIAQLLTEHAVRGGPGRWVTEEIELHLARRLWLWATTDPAAIIYDVTPGCALTCQWVKAFV